MGYQEICCHIIFRIKMDGNFTSKARFFWISYYKLTNLQHILHHCEIRNNSDCFIMKAINDLDNIAADIGNTYLNAIFR